MRYTPIFVLFFLLSANTANGQARTITNADLERFREKRLEAEREYRENFARLGFPSPEELERDREASIRAKVELSDRLRAERLRQEQAELERRRLEAAAREREVEIFADDERYPGGYFFSSSSFRGRAGRRPWLGGRVPVGWRATGGGVVYEPGGRSSHVWSPRPNIRPQRIRPRR